MTFTQDILSRIGKISENRRNDYISTAELEYQVPHEKIKSFSDFDVAFMDIFLENIHQKDAKIATPEQYNMVLDFCQAFYGNTMINFEDYIREFGINFPTEESEIWSLMFEVVGGDLVVILNYDGFEFKGLTSSD